MKAARLHHYGDDKLRLDEVPDPAASGPHDVIVRIGGAGVCRTDLHVMEGIWRGIQDPELPYTLGHENAGWVEEVGPSVTSVRPGDAVIVHPLVTDGVCPACRRGDDMHCEHGLFPGLNVDGGFAGYLKTSERATLKLAAGVEPRAAAPYADAGLTAYRAAKRAAALLPPGSHVAVIGVGGLGHIGVQCLRALTAAQIIAVDTSGEALRLAERVGADATVHAAAGQSGGAPGDAADAATTAVATDTVAQVRVAHGRRRRAGRARLRRRARHDVRGPGDARRRRHVLRRGLRRPRRHLGDRVHLA